jgi:ATP-binding cassette subfamily B protein
MPMTRTHLRSVGDRWAASIALLRPVVARLSPYRWWFAGAVGAMLIQTVLGLVPFLVVRDLVDDLGRHHTSFGHVLVLCAAGLGLVALAGLVGVVRAWLVLRITSEVIADLREELLTTLLGQSVGYFTDIRAGELMSRILNDVSVIESVMAGSALALLSSLMTLAASVVAMFVFAWQLAAVTLIVLPPLALILRLGGRRIFRARRDVQERIAAFTAHTQEVLSLSGIMLVKSFGRELDERQRSHGLIGDLRRSTVHSGMTATWVGLGLQLSQYLGPLVLLLAGGYLVVHGDASLGTVIAFIVVLALRFGASVSGLGNGALQVIGVLPSWQRVLAVLDAEPAIRDRPGARSLDVPRGAVRLDEVSFRYPGQTRWALDSVSLDVPPGRLVALVGPSGAGKTTLTSLLARLYDPQQGAVSIDGHDLRDLRLQSLAEAIGLVLQDTYLFHGTLRENLRYARPGADEELLAAACRDAHLDEVVAQLPAGLDTVVGERGHRLSGGERQRVAIARVILKDSPILILDEATSHLDSASERTVQDALSRLFAGRSSFVIAHRLSTVLAADVIVVLDRGRVAEQGTHEQLLDARGLYASLYELQFRTRAGTTSPI